MAKLSASIPKAKQTTLGLYVTAKEAYAKWLAAPQQVKKNSGCPWTKKLTPERMVLPKASSWDVRRISRKVIL